LAHSIRVLTWNIGNGNEVGRADENSALPLIADRIDEQMPDLVLLNQIRHWNEGYFGSLNQTDELMTLTQMPYGRWGRTTRVGIAGLEAAAVMSLWPLGDAIIHAIPAPYPGPEVEAHAILQTSVVVEEKTHHVFSLRLNPAKVDEQVGGLNVLRRLIKSLPPDDGVIVGGDFGCHVGDAHFDDFAARAELRNPALEKPDKSACEPQHAPVDHILFRGNYVVHQYARRCNQPNPSGHPWVVVELRRPPAGKSRFACGTTLLAGASLLFGASLLALRRSGT
jgi:hypothetical protein